MEKTTKEFKLTSIRESAETINAIKENFDKKLEEQENIVVRFDDSIVKNEFLECLKILFDFEIQSGFTIDILIKNLSYEYRKEALSLALKTEAVENNPNAVEMENLYVYLFDAMDVTILAKILSSVKDPSIWETKKIVINSLGYLGQIAEKFVFANTIMEMIGKALMEKSVKDVIDAKVEE